MGLSRVQPRKGLSRNQIIGAIYLELEQSSKLKEKTNREGFDENPYFHRFLRIVKSILAHLNTERSSDRKELDNYFKKDQSIEKIGFNQSINALQKQITKNKMEGTLYPLVNKVEKDYQEMRNIMVNAGMSGMNLSLIFHELERGVRGLTEAIRRKESPEILEIKSKYLTNLLEGFTPLLRQKKRSHVSIKELIEAAKKINEGRFAYHNIIFSSPVLTGEVPDFSVTGNLNLLLSSISNLIDNAIYWTRLRSEKEGIQSRIMITTSLDGPKGPMLIISDNGEGFSASPDEVIRPFFTKKPDGMGLGLYYVSLVMEINGGRILFPSAEDLDLPKSLNRGIVALQFREEEDITIG